jgi:glyoxylase-like metal-dependent hydrolase (beta-lactamase superfamily II)/ferredoxin
MANRARAWQGQPPGEWFVDDGCIDCDACRQLAPAVFGDGAAYAVVTRQPAADELVSATRALVACPTSAIGGGGERAAVADLFPEHLDDAVYYCGYNAESSFGANSFFAVRAAGNLLVDSPRWTRRLVTRFEQLGGVSHVLLTHRDDVADAQRYAAHFGSRVWIHDGDRRAAPFATDVVSGREPVRIRPDLLCVPVPGHTKGSVVWLLDDTFCFTGDSLQWDTRREDLGAFRSVCWYSWPEQTASLERLAAWRFEWVLAGHGGRAHRPADEMRDRLRALVARMRATP